MSLAAHHINLMVSFRSHKLLINSNMSANFYGQLVHNNMLISYIADVIQLIRRVHLDYNLIINNNVS